MSGAWFLVISALLAVSLLAGPLPVAALSESVSGAAQAQTIHDYMPRIYGGQLNMAWFSSFSNFSFDTVPLRAYLIGTAVLGVFGAFFALVSILWGAGFCCGRYFCNSCGGKAPAPDGYSRKQIRNTLLFVAVSGLLSAGAVATLWTYSNELHSELTDTSAGAGLVADIETAFDGTLQNIETANTTLIGLPAKAGPLQTFLTEAVGELELIELGSGQIVSTLNSIAGAVYSGLSFTVPARAGANGTISPAVWTCQICGPAHTQLESTIATIESYSSALPSAVSAIQSVLANMQTGQSDLTNTTNSISSQLTSVYNSITSDRTTFDNDRQNVLGKYEAVRWAVLIAVMCLPVVALLLVLAGSVTKKGGWFCGAAVLGWVAVTVFALIFIPLLPATSAVSDACVVLNYLETDLANVTSATIDEATNDCLTNSSMGYALNLTGQVAAVQQKYDVGTDLTAHVEQIDLTTVTASVMATDAFLNNFTFPIAFGLNDTMITAYIAQLNAVVAQYMVPPVVYTRTTLVNVNDSTPGATTDQHNAVIQYKYLALQLLDSEAVIGNFLTQLNANATTASSLYITLATAVGTAQAMMLAVPTLVNEMFQGLTNILIETFWCGWLGDDYRAIKQDLCTDVALDLGVISLALFVAIVCLAPFVIAAVVMAKRIQAPADLLGAGQVMAPGPNKLFQSDIRYDDYGNVAAVNIELPTR